MKKVKIIDGISDEVFDILVKKYSENKNIRIIDSRKEISQGKLRGYFLIGTETRSLQGLEWTFIWIHGNLWQFRYVNPKCSHKGAWINPIDLLNKLLDKTNFKPF